MKNVGSLTWHRRRFLGAGAAMVLSGTFGVSRSTLASTAPDQERILSFHNLHTGESLTRPYRVGDRYISGSLAEIDHLLRDFRTGDVKSMDPALLDLLYDLRSLVENAGPFHVISGYRSPKTNQSLAQKSNGIAKKSLHMKGMAIDVRLPGTPLPQLRKAALSLKGGGVGYYQKSDFVHLDTGRVRFW